MAREGISESLRRAGVAASTIREALADYILAEPENILRKLATCTSTLDALITVQAQAMAFINLKRELDNAMRRGGTDE